jgi:ABC-type multidrug transport system fused ATPase/permease subunit
VNSGFQYKSNTFFYRDNIKLSRIDASVFEVVEAAKKAQCHDFIMNLKENYETKLEQNDLSLSQSQKFRISLARALLVNPKILLIEDFPSDFDSETEKNQVEEAMNRAKLGRTTMINATNEETFKNADLILCISEGKVKEVDSYEEFFRDKNFDFKEKLSFCNLNKSKTESELETQMNLIDQDIKEPIIQDKYPIIVQRDNRKQVSKFKLIKNKVLFYQRKLLSINKPEKTLIIVGCLCQTINGVLLLAASIIFTQTFNLFKTRDLKLKTKLSQEFMSIIFALAVLSFIVCVTASNSFSIANSAHIKRLRLKMFESMLRQEIAFHDLNGPSILCAMLRKCKNIIAADKIGLVFQSLSCLLFSLIFSMIINWKLAFLMLCFTFILVLIEILASKIYFSNEYKTKKLDIQALLIFTETIENKKLVSSLQSEEFFLNLFKINYKIDLRKRYALLHVEAILNSLSKNVHFFVQCAAFSFGFYLMKSDLLLTTSKIFSIYEVMTLCSLMLRRVYCQIFDKKRDSAAKLAFNIIERSSKIDSLNEQGLKPDRVKGTIRFENVNFAHPKRPDVKIFKEFNLNIENGETVALIGNKNTNNLIEALLLRFYDVDSGKIYIGEYDIKELNVKWLRSRISLLSDESFVLFNTNICENIRYGNLGRKTVNK